MQRHRRLPDGSSGRCPRQAPGLTGPCLQFPGEPCPGCVAVVGGGFDPSTPSELRGIRANSRDAEQATAHEHVPGFHGSRDPTDVALAASVCGGHAGMQPRRSRLGEVIGDEVERRLRTLGIVCSPCTGPIESDTSFRIALTRNIACRTSCAGIDGGLCVGQRNVTGYRANCKSLTDFLRRPSVC